MGVAAAPPGQPNYSDQVHTTTKTITLDGTAVDDAVVTVQNGIFEAGKIQAQPEVKVR